MKFSGNLDDALEVVLSLGLDPARGLLLTPNRATALQIQDHLIRYTDRQGVVGDAIRPWRDYAGELFRRVEPDRRALPADVSARLVERAVEKVRGKLESLGEVLAEPGACEDVAQTLESLMSAGRETVLGLAGSARNRDLARIAAAWLEEADAAGLVSRNEIPHRVQAAVEAGEITETREILIVSPSEEIPDPGLVEALEKSGTPGKVRLFRPASSAGGRAAEGSLLARLQTEAVRPRAGQFAGASSDGTLRILACSGEEDECRRVLETIKRGILEGRWQARDCAIVVRDGATYLAHLEKTAAALGVPVSIRQQRPLENLPLTGLLLAPLRLVEQGFQRETVASFIRHPAVAPWFAKACAGWDPGRLTHVLREHGIGGPGEEDGQAWIDHLTRVLAELEQKKQRLEKSEADEIERERIKARLDAELEFLRQHRRGLQGLFDLVGALPPSGTVDEYRHLLPALYRTLDIGDSLARQGAAGYRHHPRWVERDFIALYQVRRALESLAARTEWIGESEREFTAGEVLARLRLILEEHPVPVHHRADEAVSVVRPEELRPEGYAGVFVMGVLQGSYPRTRRSPALVDEAVLERTALAPAAQRRAEEDLLAQVVGAARGFLLLSYPHTGEDGRSRLYAGVIEHLRQALRQAGVDDPAGDLDREVPFSLRLRPPEQCYDAESLLETLCAGLRRGSDGASAGIYNIWREDPARRARMQRIARPAVMEAERGSWREPGSYDGRLEDFESLWPLFEAHVFHKEFSTSRINTYAACPAQYFYGQILGLNAIEPPEPGLTPLEKGSLLHDMMRDFLERSEDLRFPLSEAEVNRALQRLESAAERLFQPRYYPDKSRALLEVEFEILRRHFRVIVQREVANEHNAGFRPRYFEHSFKDLEVPVDQDGNTVRFRGRIDRVDWNDAEESFAVIDYKTGGAPSLKDILEGREFQLPIYARAVMAKHQAASCAMAYYYKLLDTSNRDRPKEPQPRYRYADAGAESLWETTVQPALARLLLHLSRGGFVPRPNPESTCDYCDFRALCRYSAPRLRMKTKRDEDRGEEG